MKRRRGSLKKITAMFMVVLMVGTAVELPVPVHAEETVTMNQCTEDGCEGTYVNGFCSESETHYEAPQLNAEGYYEIGNAGELYWFAAHVNEGGDNLSSNAVLTADIVVNEGVMTAESTGVKEWVPIGDFGALINDPKCKYSGHFDGQGHCVSGLFHCNSESDYLGLFGYVEGMIENVGVRNSYILGGGIIGGIAGGSKGTIKNCYIINTTLESIKGRVGGIVAHASGGTIKRCFNMGLINGYQHVGGIVENVAGETIIEECYNGGIITCESTTVGGIVAFLSSNAAKIINCYNVGSVNGRSRVGGIVGWSQNLSGKRNIKNCYNIGDVFSNTTYLGNVGAIVGVVNAVTYNATTCEDCFYLSGSAKNKNNNIHNGIGGINNSSVKLENEVGCTTSFETAALTSGEICYLLNNGVTNGTQAFYQTVGSGMPTFSGDTVYYGYADCDATEMTYANTPLNATMGHLYSADCDRNCNYCDSIREVEIIHDSITYELENTTIKATCGVCNESIGSVTISLLTDSLTYDGTEKAATLTGGIEDVVTPQIVYNTESGTAPIDAGNYTASVTVGDKTATVSYQIESAIPDIGTVSADEIFDTLQLSAVRLHRTKNGVEGILSLSSPALYYGTRDYDWNFAPADRKNNYAITQGTVSITVTDTIAPTVKYRIGNGELKPVGVTTQEGVISKEYQTVTLFFFDENGNGENGSGIKSKQYFVSYAPIDDPVTITAWTDDTSGVMLSEPGQYYIYVKAVDQFDNTFIGCVERIVIYKESTAGSVTETYTYKENRDFFVPLSLNGNTVKEVRVGNETLTPEDYTVSGDAVTVKAAYMDTLPAGAYTVTIELSPQGVDTETVTLQSNVALTVTKVPLTVTEATVEGKVYDGSDAVVVTDVMLQGVRENDDVGIDTDSVRGVLSGSKAGVYSGVMLEDMALIGAQKENYTLMLPEGEVPTTVVIQKRDDFSVDAIECQYLCLRANSDSIGLSGFLPADCGAVQYGIPQVQGDISYKEIPMMANGVLTYTVDAGEVGTEGTIVVPVVTENYEDITITVEIRLSDQKTVALEGSSAAMLENRTLTYGEALDTLLFNRVVFVDEGGNEVPGTLAWKDAAFVPDTRVNQATWVFTPESVEYAQLEGTVEITVNKADKAPNQPECEKKVTYDVVTVAAISLPEDWQWQDASLGLKPGEAVKAIAVYAGADRGNYKEETVEVVITRACCNHEETKVSNELSAGCVTPGYTGDVVCIICEETLQTGTEIKAFGHRYSSVTTKQPTTEEDGECVYTCLNCGLSYTATLAKLPIEKPAEGSGVPILLGMDGLFGWDAVMTGLHCAKPGDVLTINMNGGTILPKAVLQVLKEKDVSLVLQMIKGISWKIGGKDVTKPTEDIDFGVCLGTAEAPIHKIPNELLRSVTKEYEYVNMSLNHDGMFGFDALLSVTLHKKTTEFFANLFYYNEETGKLEFMSADRIGEDGTAKFVFEHASEYTIVLAERSLEPTESVTEPEITPEPTVTPEPTTVPEPEEVTGYTVQVGAYVKKSNAEKVMKKASQLGYDMHLEDGAELYKVQTELFDTKADAGKMAEELSTHGFDTYILRTKRWKKKEETVTGEGVLPPVSEKKSAEELAYEVMQGRWGNGTERKKRLTEAGYNYAEVQKLVNARLN